MERIFESPPRPAVLPSQGTIPVAAGKPLWREHPPWRALGATITLTPPIPPRRVLIRGVTREGRAFRPSDWAERLAGAMSCFRPEGTVGGISAYIGYSPLCVPHVIDGVRSVLVDETLREVEPMAWDFVMNFARDNDLQVDDVTSALPEG